MVKKSKLQKKKDNHDSPYWNKKALKTWSMVIRMKADNHCEMCNRDNCKLDAHHIQSKVFKNTRFKIENGICLCPKCHKFGIMSAHKSLVFYEWLRTNKPTQYQWILDNYNREDNRTCKEAYEELEEISINRVPNKDTLETLHNIENGLTFMVNNVKELFIEIGE